jgi:hypothetical protein
MIHIRQSMQNTLQIRAAESCCKVVVVTLIAVLVLLLLVVAGAVVRQRAWRARREREGHAPKSQARLRVLQTGIIMAMAL